MHRHFETKAGYFGTLQSFKIVNILSMFWSHQNKEYKFSSSLRSLKLKIYPTLVFWFLCCCSANPSLRDCLQVINVKSPFHNTFRNNYNSFVLLMPGMSYLCQVNMWWATRAHYLFHSMVDNPSWTCSMSKLSLSASERLISHEFTVSPD